MNLNGVSGNVARLSVSSHRLITFIIFKIDLFKCSSIILVNCLCMLHQASYIKPQQYVKLIILMACFYVIGKYSTEINECLHLSLTRGILLNFDKGLLCPTYNEHIFMGLVHLCNRVIFLNLCYMCFYRQ